MGEENFGQRAVRKTVSFMKKLLLILILLAAGTFAFLYWGTYETGTKAGKVIGVSEKGILFKTFEGKLNLESFGALKGTSPIAETFDFSVESSEADVIKGLQEVALSGERVNLHFRKRYMQFPWRGDTKVFIIKVERAGAP